MISDAVRAQLTPMGKLRVAIAVGPVPSAVFSIEDGNGGFRGVPVTLAQNLAAVLGVGLTFLPFDSSGAIQSTAIKNRWDISFMPADEDRRKLVDFSHAYHVAQSTYLVPAGSALADIASADAPDIRIVGLLNTATFRASQLNAPRAVHIAAASAIEAVEMIRRGEGEALALGRDALLGIRRHLPGSRVVDGAFFNSTTAIAVQKGLTEGLAFINAFIEGEKRNGNVRRALDEMGLDEALVAPAHVED